jgi:DNA (cytosine-5)-methyltransferase 1
MQHLDLCSGIGGFALAARWMNWQTIAFCERDKFCQKVLKKHWPEVDIYDDLTTFDASEFMGRVDILTGGYPCQPFSQAGKRLGAEDDRHLWPEVFRIIKECRPRWICCENVAGHITLGLDDVLTDLEGEDYAAQAVVIPACATGAPHRRDRVWIIANAPNGHERQAIRASKTYSQYSSNGRNGVTSDSDSRTSAARGQSQDQGRTTNALSGSGGDASNANQQRVERGAFTRSDSGDQAQSYDQQFRRCEIASPSDSNSDRESNGSIYAQVEILRSDAIPNWAGGSFGQPSPLTHWRDGKEWEAFGAICNLDDGLRERLVRDRVNKLKALGNAIVPPVAHEIFKAIKLADSQEL